MKKIGLLNFQHSNDNYGAVIQAAALTHIIKKYSANVEHINFIPEEDAPPPLSLNERIKRLLSKDLLNIINNKLLKILNNLFLNKKNIIGNTNTFEDFRNNFIPRTDRCYKNLQELSELKEDYSAIIVGSDQVWRLTYTTVFAKAYFLSFASKNTKRISYAASFGLNHWEEEKDSELSLSIKKELDRFDAISVRESSGISICSDIFNVKATHVLDPTLLVDYQFYNNILLEQNSKNIDNIIFYKLDLNSEFIKFASEIAENYQCKLQNIYHQKRAGKQFFTDVPIWLSQIKNCKFVITDSFHCVCFAIVFKKQFICIVNKKRGMERLRSLLSDLGLIDRLCFDYSQENAEQLLNKKIDYVDINEKLNQLRDFSNAFLNDALAKVG